MALSVKKVAELVGNEIIIPDGESARDFAAALTNTVSASDLSGSPPQWYFRVTIGEGKEARKVAVGLVSFMSETKFRQSAECPYADIVTIAPGERRAFAFFRNSFFMPSRFFVNQAECEEFMLRVKRLKYREEEELTALRSYVANVEAAMQFQKNGPKRDPIPEDVKLLVWSRDGGACIRCGSKSELHFDHIIPVAKGGSGTAANIQLLCEPCNLKKSDKIAF